MIHIAIVDDEESYVSEIQKYLNQYSRESGETIKTTVFNDGDSIVHKYRSQFDIILMDVEMRFMDGMSAAEEIRRADSEVVIIFITQTPQYAIRGYAVEALDYLLKPISYFAFSQCLGRAISRMKKRRSKPITVNIKGGTARFDAHDIYYVESSGHSMIYHTSSGSYESSSTMREIEESLSELGFFRASKWYLINLAYVDSYRDGELVLGGTALSVSRARRRELFEALNAYWGEVMK